MQNEKAENQGQKNVKQNPSRFNTNVNQGQNNDKNFNEKNVNNRDAEVDSAGLDRDEIDLDRSGVGTSDSPSKNQLNAGSADGKNQQAQQAQTQQPQKPEQQNAGSGVKRDANKEIGGVKKSGTFNQDADNSTRQ